MFIQVRCIGHFVSAVWNA